jgi:hypothetical protein
MAIFDSGLSNVSILIDVPFPSNVVSGPGVQVNKTSSVWSIGLDYPDLTLNTNPGTLSSYFLAWWDQALSRYEQVRADVALGAATGADQRTAIGDTNYSVLTTDRYVGLTATLTAVRTLTLPAAASVPGGRLVTIQDEAGGISPSSYHSIVPTGSDTIDGRASFINKAKFGGVSFRSNGSNAWSLAAAFQRSAVADANYAASQGDSVIAYTSLSAARIVTLPPAASYPPGQPLTIVDESGSCSTANTIGITRAGTDTINGATSLALARAYAYVQLESNGATAWTIIDSSQISTNQLSGRTGVGDANYAILTTDSYVATTAALSAPRIWTLPASAAVPAGYELVIYDEAGGVSATNTLTIQRAGSDTVNGGTSFALNRAYQGISLRSNGAGIWAFEDPTGPIDDTVIGGVTPAAGTFTTLSTSGAVSFSNQANVAASLALAFSVGSSGTVNPALQVDTSAASSATGVKIKSAATAGGVAVSAISPGTNENLTIDAKGSGTITLGSISNGNILCSPIFKVTNNTANTGGTASSGAFQVTGGIGVGGSATVAGITYLSQNISIQSTAVRAALTLDHNGAGQFAGSINNTDTGSSSQICFQFQRNSAAVGSITTTNSSAAFNTSSDERVKVDFKPISDALALVGRISVYDHAWLGGSDHRSIGVKAQEVFQILPDIVSPTDDGTSRKPTEPDFQPWGVDYSKFVPILIAAVQEADARIRALEAKLGISS